MDKSTATIILYRILKDETDQDHYLTQKQLIDKMKDHGIEVERKTISKYISSLEECGFDIIKEAKKGVALLSRDFDTSQVTFLIDAIFSSKNFTGKQAQEMVETLESNLSKYQRKRFSYIYKSEDLNRNQDSNFFLNIELLTEAISRKRMVDFQYAGYDSTGKEILKYNGLIYKNVSPYYLVNNFGKYYLLCKNEKYDSLTNYRVDYLRNIHIKDDPVFPFEKIDGVQKPFDIKDYLNEHIYIFGGKVSDCELKILNENAISPIKEWFGNKASFTMEDGFPHVSFKCDESAFFYWCLQYGENIEVIKPQSIRVKLSYHYQDMMKRYDRNLFLESKIKPNLTSLMNSFYNYYLPKTDMEKEDINTLLLSYLNKNIASDYEIKKQDSLFLIKNRENEDEKYGILFHILSDANDFSIYESISYYEKEKKNYSSILITFMQRTGNTKEQYIQANQNYKSNDTSFIFKYDYVIHWFTVKGRKTIPYSFLKRQ